MRVITSHWDIVRVDRSRLAPLRVMVTDSHGRYVIIPLTPAEARELGALLTTVADHVDDDAGVAS